MARSSACLEVLVPKEGMVPTGDTTMFLLNWKLRLSPGHLGASHAFEKSKKGVIVLAGMNDTNYQGGNSIATTQ